MFYLYRPTMEDLKSLYNNWIFKQNYNRIMRYQKLGLDFAVYGEGKVKLFRCGKDVTQTQKRVIFSKFNGICPLCGEIGIVFNDKYYKSYKDTNGELFHIDHIVPISQGGDRRINNLQVICAKCNRKKKEALNG